jgi:hypothetical protein
MQQLNWKLVHKGWKCINWNRFLIRISFHLFMTLW